MSHQGRQRAQGCDGRGGGEATGDDAMTPWEFAKAEGRDYLTPEDLTAALKAGATPLEVAIETLAAISVKQAEDVKLCAFVAHRALVLGTAMETTKGT